jgi:hypothetical protein
VRREPDDADRDQEAADPREAFQREAWRTPTPKASKGTGFPQSLTDVALSGRARDEVTVRHIEALFSSPNGSVGKALGLSEQPTGVGGTVRAGAADDDFIGCNPVWRSFSQV